MAYNPSIPAPSDKLTVSQGQIQNNFAALDTIFSQNHFAYTAPTSAGKHKYVEIVEGTAGGVVPVGLVAGEETLYASVIAGNGEIFYARGAAATGIQLTGPGTPVATSAGTTFLAGGLILKWGTATSVGSANPNSSVTFPIAFPNNCFSIQATIQTTSDSRRTVTIYSKSKTKFEAVTRASDGSKTGGYDYYWYAIGN